MSEAHPLPNFGGEDKQPLAAVPEAVRPAYRINFAQQEQDGLSVLLTGIPEEQFSAIKNTLVRVTGENEAVKLVIKYSAEMAGMLPSSNSDEYNFQGEVTSRVNDTLRYYHDNFETSSGSVDTDKLSDLYDATNGAFTILEILHHLEVRYNTTLPEQYFKTADRIVRILINQETSDKPI